MKLQGKYPYIGEHHFCWGTLFSILEDRNGETIAVCDKCGQLFYSEEVDDRMTLKEFGPDDEA